MIGRIFASAPPIPRAENRPYEADDGDGLLAIVADPVNVPPRIAALGDVDVKARSLKIASAACLLERQAIGTPAPGWVRPRPDTGP